jgi:hypothetical protein
MIGADLGVSEARAHQIVNDALTAIVAAPAEKVRKIEVERIDHMLSVVWPCSSSIENPQACHENLRWVALPKLRALPPFRRAVPTTPADRTGACVDCFPIHAAFPVLQAGRHPRLYFRREAASDILASRNNPSPTSYLESLDVRHDVAERR